MMEGVDKSESEMARKYYRRRTALRGKVLPVAIGLEPGEDLRGSVMRAIPLNGYSQTKVPLQFAHCRSFKTLSAFSSIANGDDINRLVDVLGIREDSSRLLETLKSAGAVGREHVSFFGHRVQGAHISNVRRFSATGLRLNGYLKARWSLLPLGFDRVHRELLIDRCDWCKRLLGWASSAGVQFCEKCGFDLRKSSRTVLEVGDDEAVMFVASMVDPEVSDEEFARYRTDLKFGTRGDLFQFVAKIGSEIQRVSNGDRSCTPTPENVCLAERAVLDWPRSFLELVESTQSVQTSHESGWFKARPLRRLLYDPTLSVAIRQQVKVALDMSMRRQALVARANISPENRPIESGKRRQHPRTELLRFVGASEVENGWSTRGPMEILGVLRDIKSVRQNSIVLGLPTSDVYELYSEGLLPHLQGELAPLGFVHDGDVECFNLLDSLSKLPLAKQAGWGLSLASARFTLDQRLSGRWSSLFRAICAGTLEAKLDPRGERSLSSSILIRDFRTLKLLLERPAAVDALGTDPQFTQAELGMVLGQSTTLASEIVRSGLLSVRCRLSDLVSFRSEWIFSFELKCLQRIYQIPGDEVATFKLSKSARIRLRLNGLWSRQDAIHHFGLPGAQLA